MFEGTIPSGSSAGPAEAGVLNGFAWPELVAKLAAARDLRAIFAADSRQSLASFAEGAARALADCGHAERYVNPDDLTDGKAHTATYVSVADHARDGDREMK